MSSRFLLILLKDDNEAGSPKPREASTWIIVMDFQKFAVPNGVLDPELSATSFSVFLPGRSIDLQFKDF